VDNIFDPWHGSRPIALPKGKLLKTSRSEPDKNVTGAASHIENVAVGIRKRLGRRRKNVAISYENGAVNLLP